MADASLGRMRENSLAGERDEHKFAAGVCERFDKFQKSQRSTFRHSRILRSARLYHSESNNTDETRILTGGDQGELTIVRVNHYRNLVQHQLNLVTQATPSYEVYARTADAKAKAQVRLAQGILDYYFQVHRLDQTRVRRAELALVCGESWLHAPWDKHAGKRYASDGERAVTQGDLTFDPVPAWCVAYDWRSRNLMRPREVILYRPELRFEFAARYSTHRDAILRADPFREEIEGVSISLEDCADEYIGVYYYYSERSSEVPEGRQAIVLDKDRVLEQGPLELERIPAFRLPASERLYGAGGHTNNFDLLAVTEAHGAELSTILSNHSTFGGQHVAYPRGCKVKPHEFGQGFTAHEYDPQFGPPQGMSFHVAQKEFFDFADVLMQQAEVIAGVSAVNRGDVASSKGDSGAKSALFASMAQQFATSFFHNLRRSDEDLGSHVIDTMRRKATTKRVIMIGGRSTGYAAKEFAREDLEQVELVSVRAASPYRDTFQGRMELADKVAQMKGGPSTSTKYIAAVTTGNFDSYFSEECEETLIIRENEALGDLSQDPPLVAPIDQHLVHIDYHKQVLADPEVRRDEERRRRVIEHIEWHAACLDPESPQYAGDALLMSTGQKALPRGKTPAGDGQQPPMPPAPPGGPAGPGQEGLEPPPQVKPGKTEPAPVTPGAPEMPDLPINPQTGQRAPSPGPPGEPPMAAAM